MQHIRRFILCLILAPALVSCYDMERDGSHSRLLLRIADGGALTKGETAATAAEEAVVSGSIFLWDSSGHLYRSRRLEGRSEVVFDSIADGRYTVCVAANMPSDLEADSCGELEARPVALGDNDPAGAFVMYGKDDVTVAGMETSSVVYIQRYPSRIRLTKVVNATGGDVTIRGAMLINVRDTWTVGAEGPAAGWSNLAGRVDGQVVTAATAQCSALTYVDGGDRLLKAGDSLAPQWPLYCLPNATQTDEYGPKATSGKTRLVVVASVGGTTTYYPVTIDPRGGMRRNASYDVELTMLSLGSTDPNTLVPTGAMTVCVTVDGYNVIDYNENF